MLASPKITRIHKVLHPLAVFNVSLKLFQEGGCMRKGLLQAMELLVSCQYPANIRPKVVLQLHLAARGLAVRHSSHVNSRQPQTSAVTKQPRLPISAPSQLISPQQEEGARCRAWHGTSESASDHTTDVL